MANKFDLKTNEGVLDSLDDFARRIFDPSEVILPMFVLVDDKGEVELVSAVLTSDTDKDSIAEMVKQRVRTHKAVRIGFLTEAWFLDSKDAPEMLNGVTPIPSEHDKRRECIQILVEDQWGKHISRVLEIVRESADKATLKLHEQMTGGEVAGRFSHFFDVQHVTTH